MTQIGTDYRFNPPRYEAEVAVLEKQGIYKPFKPYPRTRVGLRAAMLNLKAKRFDGRLR